MIALWGPGPLENSAAIEFLAELDDAGLHAVDARFRTARDDERIAADDACILAAAELVAQARQGVWPAAELELPPLDAPALAARAPGATDALIRVVRASALRDEMSALGWLAEWLQETDDLARRLR